MKRIILCKNCKELKEHNAFGLCNKCYQIEYRKKYPDKAWQADRNWRLKNIEYLRKYQCNWRLLNLEHVREVDRKRQKHHNLYIRNRKHTNIDFKIRSVLSTRIGMAVLNQKSKKAYSTMKLLGCSIQQFRNHIEKQFKKGMTWENHTFYGWHLHHIKPCMNFDLSKEEEQKKCFHYTNYKPMWWEEHLKLNHRIDVEDINK